MQPVEILSLDFETASRADLRRVGAHHYARHRTTRVLCLAWAFDAEDVTVWRPGQPFPMRIILHVLNGGRVAGWNVVFEWLIWNHVLRLIVPQLPGIEPGQLLDTMARAAYWGLPLKLEQAAIAARLNIHKDSEGHKLMLQMCRPRQVKADGSVTWWHEDDPAKYDRLCSYCATDVEAERAIARHLPPLPAKEQRYWVMDLEMNARGVPIDVDLVHQLKDLALRAVARANVALASLTQGAVKTIGSTARLLAWLMLETTYPGTNLQKQTVAERLDDPACDGLERQVLSLRADNAKTSAAKLDAMLAAAGEPHGVQYVRGMLQYHGALRTGRWAGRLIQLQNIPRGSIKIIEEVIRAIEAGHGLDVLELFFANGLDVVTSALRGCISPRPGRQLFVADFSQIEARCLAWLAGQLDMLDVFADPTQDPYVYAASLQGSTNRNFGKVLVLALGYGMKGEKFQATAKLYGVILTLEQANAAVRAWRQQNRAIVDFWYACEDAALSALRHPGREYVVGPVKFCMWRGHLLVRLPSEHVLIFREARVDDIDGRRTITYMGLDQYTRKWTRLRTWGAKIAENITQALARDVMAEASLIATADHLLALCLMVHDELIGEADVKDADDALAQLLSIMRRRPDWGPDLPIEAVGWVGRRYKK